MNYIWASYLPRSKSERRDWLNGFSAGLRTYAVELGVAPATLAELDERTQWVNYIGQLQGEVARFERGLIDFSDELDTDASGRQVEAPHLSASAPPPFPARLGTFNWVVTLITEQIHGSPAWREEMANGLNLQARPDIAPDTPEIRRLKAAPGGMVALSFLKGAAKLVIIEGQRGGGAWEILDKVVAAKWVDARPNLAPGVSESRSYRTRFSDGVAPYGLYSGVKSVSTQG